MRIRSRISLFLVLLLLSFLFSNYFLDYIKGDCLYTYSSDQNFQPLYYENDLLYLREGKSYFKPFPTSIDLKLKIDPILHFHQLESPFTSNFLTHIKPEKKTFTFLNKNNELIQEFYSIYYTPVWQSHSHTKLSNGDTAFLSKSSDLYFEIDHYLKLYEQIGIKKEAGKYILDQTSRKSSKIRFPFLSIDKYSNDGNFVSKRLIPVKEDFSKKKHELMMHTFKDNILIFYITSEKITLITLKKDNSFMTQEFENRLKDLPNSSLFLDGNLILLKSNENLLKRTVFSINDKSNTLKSFVLKNKIVETAPINKDMYLLLTQDNNRDYIELFDNDKRLLSLGNYYPASYKDLKITEGKKTLVYQEQIDNNTFKVYRKKIF